MGEPKFYRNKRYVNKDGKKFGKGVWLGYNKVLYPGFGDFNRDNRTVTQYNTDGTKTVYTWEQWHKKKTLEHETKVLQNDRKWGIPYIPEKNVTLHINKPGYSRNRGASFSENVLDSIAVNAKRAGIPFSTGLGIASRESTIGSHEYRLPGTSLLGWLRDLNTADPNFPQYNINANRVNYTGYYSPSILVSNWKQRSDQPFVSN